MIYVTKIFVSLDYCWPLKSLTQGPPARLLTHLLGTEAPFPRHPALKRCLSLWYFWDLPFGKSHILMQTCQCGPEKAACLWTPPSWSHLILLKPFELPIILPVFEYLLDLEIFDSLIFLLKVYVKILKQGFFTISEPVTMLHLSACVFLFLTMFRHDVTYIL